VGETYLTPWNEEMASSKKEKASSADRNGTAAAAGMTEREKAIELALTQIERRF
jgi:hypothetical protein